MRQNNQVELNLGTGATGEARSAAAQEPEARAARTDVESQTAIGPSMEAVVERRNLRKALARVKANKGAPGIDGMTFENLAPYLKEHWPTIRAQLLDGTYKPQPLHRPLRVAASACSPSPRVTDPKLLRLCNIYGCRARM